MSRKKNARSDDYNAAFPTRLREIMAEKNKTQQDVANAIGKTRQAVGYYTDGSSSPDWKTLVELSRYFDVSVDWLLGRTNARINDETVKIVCNYTGLSEKAALGLSLNKNDGNPLRALIDLIAADSVSNIDFVRYCQLTQVAAEISRKSKSTPSPTDALVSAMWQAYTPPLESSVTDSPNIIHVSTEPDGYMNVPAVDMQLFYSDAAIRTITDYAEEIIRDIVNEG